MYCIKFHADQSKAVVKSCKLSRIKQGIQIPTLSKNAIGRKLQNIKKTRSTVLHSYEYTLPRIKQDKLHTVQNKARYKATHCPE